MLITRGIIGYASPAMARIPTRSGETAEVRRYCGPGWLLAPARLLALAIVGLVLIQPLILLASKMAVLWVLLNPIAVVAMRDFEQTHSIGT